MPPWTHPAPHDTDPLSDWALWYATQGWPVFPCRGKVPWIAKTAGGNGHRDATTDPSQVAAWWQQWPTANIGCPSGSHWWGLDVDPKNRGDDSLFQLQAQHGLLPHTLLSHTGGGGNHYFWLPPGQPVQNKADIGEGLDVQADGQSYLILPPSIHPGTGKPYLWDLVDGPEDISPQPAPPWLEVLVMQHTNGMSPPKVVAAPGAPIPQGTRDNTLTQFAGAMRRQHASVEEIRAALEVRNLRCVPPLASDDLDRIAQSVGRYTPTGQFLASSQAVPNMVQPQPSPLPALLSLAPSPASSEPLSITDFADMLERTYPKQAWLVQDLIPEGLTFMVGSPKSSKTYLAYSLALAVAGAGETDWLGTYPILHPGPVVYITLEDDEGDSRERVAELMPDLLALPRERLLFIHGFELPALGDGLVERLTTDVMERYHPSLLVLDPISYLYAPTKKSADQFAEVKKVLLPLRWLGKNNHCAVVGVDHRRKKSVDDIDIFETTYGSNAKIAVADALLMIVREQVEITVHARVRKAADQTLTLTLTFDEHGCAHWAFKGAHDGLLGADNYGEFRARVCQLLAERAGRQFTIEDIIIELDLTDSKQTRSALNQALLRAQKAGDVGKNGRNNYTWVGGI